MRTETLEKGPFVIWDIYGSRITGFWVFGHCCFELVIRAVIRGVRAGTIVDRVSEWPREI